MKHFIFSFFFALMAFSSACGMFILKFHVMNKEVQLTKMHKQIMDNNRSIHVLKAEWTNLNNPERLIVLTKENTSLTPTKQSQIINWDNVKFSSDNKDKDS